MTTTQERTDEFVPDWEKPEDADLSWRRHMGPFSHLYEDIWRIYYKHLKVCWDEWASPMAREHIATFIEGHSWVRGPEFDDGAKARLGALMQRASGMSSLYHDEIKPEVVEIVTRLKDHPDVDAPYEELLAHVDECADAAAYIFGHLHWKMAAGSIAGERGPGFHWPDIYVEITGRPKQEAAVLISGKDSALTKAIKQLYNLARLAASDADVFTAVQAGDLDMIKAGGTAALAKFRDALDDLLAEYGQRTGNGWGAATTWESPTWSMRPDIPLGMIASYAKADMDAVENKGADASRERERLLQEVRDSLSPDPNKLARFEEELTKAAAFSDVIEDHNHWMDQCAPGLLREAVHILGQRLVRDGVVDDPRDVVHLSRAELGSLPVDARTLVAERRQVLERRRETELPEHIGTGEPEPNRMRELADKGEGRVGNELRGVAASPGKFTGVARVRMPSPIFPDVDENEILIAVDAGPDWTPVFAILGAVVLDHGAAWQHAAVMAREFGIPAVTGTNVGTKEIKDGDVITVDGDAGIVTLADRA